MKATRIQAVRPIAGVARHRKASLDLLRHGLLSLIVLCFGAAAEAEDPRTTPLHSGLRPTIPVAVLAASHVRDTLLKRVFAEVDAIWQPAGIAFDWHRLATDDDAGTTELDVTIDDRQQHGTMASWETALGWIVFTADGPVPSIHLSRMGAEALIRQAPGFRDLPVGMHEALVGRALGRALSHELGHYVLRSKVHTPHGLMQAIWSPAQLLAIDRQSFELTPQQRELAATRSYR